jgi:hypothetical protein
MSIVVLFYCYDECHYGECHYAEIGGTIVGFDDKKFYSFS